MPLTYEIVPDDAIVTIRGDFATPDEWRAVLTHIADALRDQTGLIGILRDRRGATAPVDAHTIVSIIDVIAQLWSGVRLCGIAILTGEADDLPGQIAVAVADSCGIPLMASDSEEA